MRKILLTLSFIISFSLSFSQDQEGTALNDFQSFTNSVAATNSVNAYGGSVSFNNPRRKILGSFYLLDEWENNGVIVTKDNKKFSIQNINLNIKSNSFESKVRGNKKVFVFNFNNIDKFIINNKVYKKYFSSEDSRVYQIIYENKDFQLLKGYSVKFVEGSANPMLNRSFDKFVRQESIFIRKNDEVKKFKLKRSKIVGLIGKEKTNEIKAFAKKKDLSFKKEKDVKKILAHFIQ
ncbi:hypothetical protein OD91_2278 [Lutibacter sp. Hel_I_33_5]|uniref:hypothetical protein n=1 Tax=Lutibacter sp. Hel_I_33_5 TaxID=1566289 RepID=UPI0011A6AFBA|nr:hypothetical protein [Lutibacter sp. Hel_I_33_5]TVZ56974.1 hypothetical protein OD91_2278 [Lutibacter sp. Hel_I_33_5]